MSLINSRPSYIREPISNVQKRTRMFSAPRYPSGGTAFTRLMPWVRSFSQTNGASNAAGTIGFTYPANPGQIAADDMGIAVITVNDRGAGADISNTATGWTHIGKKQNGESATSVFYKRLDGTETGAVTPFTWSSSDATNDTSTCFFISVRGVDWTTGPLVGSVVTGSGADLAAIDFPTLTSDTEACLAIMGLGFTDEGATSGIMTEGSGSTGGTWYMPTTKGASTTGADDVSCCFHVAELATAGTITGGTINQATSTPLTSKWSSVSFVILGKQYTNIVSTSSTIAASADDASENTGTTAVTITGTTLTLASSLIGMRFTGLGVLHGKTIDRASLQFSAGQTGSGSISVSAMKIQAEAADDAAQYAATDANISGRTLDSTAPEFQLAQWVLNERTLKQRCTGLAACVQAVTDRAGYAGVINFVIQFGTGATQTRVSMAIDHASASTEATLTVWYH